MDLLSPQQFAPIFQNYVWGGRRLETILHKRLPSDAEYAESWEVVDHDNGQSIVTQGEFEGWSLSQLVAQRGPELLGRHHPQEKFPLLFKFLDCQRNLSVQVHPNDEQGALLEPPDLGKTEAWVILAAEPGSSLYAGLKAGVDRAAFEKEIQNGTADNCLHRIVPAVGDCIFIPAGTVHALCAGLLVAEIQQSSNTTFRLFDWNRVDASGQSRPLHITQGLNATDFERGPIQPQTRQPTDMDGVERLVACDKFVLDRIELTPESTCGVSKTIPAIGGDGTCHIVAVVEGSVRLGNTSLTKGQTALLPAAYGACPVEATSATVLDMYLP